MHRNILQHIKQKIPSLAAYLATFYFIDIMQLMFSMAMSYGRIYAITWGLTLALALTVHIILLYSRRNINRKIHLFIIDIHIAFSLALLYNWAVTGFEAAPLYNILAVIRAVLIIAEIFLFYFLTDRDVIKEYS